MSNLPPHLMDEEDESANADHSVVPSKYGRQGPSKYGKGGRRAYKAKGRSEGGKR